MKEKEGRMERGKVRRNRKVGRRISVANEKGGRKEGREGRKEE